MPFLDALAHGLAGYETGRTRTGDVRISWRARGSGDAVLLTRGWPMTGSRGIA